MVVVIIIVIVIVIVIVMLLLLKGMLMRAILSAFPPQSRGIRGCRVRRDGRSAFNHAT